jgi:hypothetical protein
VPHNEVSRGTERKVVGMMLVGHAKHNRVGLTIHGFVDNRGAGVPRLKEGKFHRGSTISQRFPRRPKDRLGAGHFIGEFGLEWEVASNFYDVDSKDVAAIELHEAHREFERRQRNGRPSYRNQDGAGIDHRSEATVALFSHREILRGTSSAVVQSAALPRALLCHLAAWQYSEGDLDGNGGTADEWYTPVMSLEAEREGIMQRFTCAHVRLTRALVSAPASSEAAYRWAPGCVHPKMHSLFDGQVSFCERCPCYMRRAGTLQSSQSGDDFQ